MNFQLITWEYNLSTKYPHQIDGQGELPVSIDLVTPVKADVVNNLRGAIIAIESELGTDPSRDFGTVKARIDALERGGAGLNAILDEGVVVLNNATQLNFEGSGVTATVAAHYPGRVNVAITGSGGTALSQVQETLPTANGQTAFTLSEIPQNSAAVEMFVNGLKQTYGTDYTVVGTVVTYAGVPLITSDVVEFWYINLGIVSGGGNQTLAQTLVFGNATGGKNISMTNGDAIVAPDGYLDLNVLTGGINPPLIRFKKNGADFLTFNPSASVHMTLAENSGDFSLLYKNSQPILNASGSSINIISQNGNGSGSGGNISLNAGNGSGSGGNISLNAGSSNNAGGFIDILSGPGAPGGNINIISGNDTGASGAGIIYIQGGVSSSNFGGSINIMAGDGGTGHGGSLNLQFGEGGTSNGVYSLNGPWGVGQGSTFLFGVDPNLPTTYTESSVAGTLNPALYFQYLAENTTLVHQRMPVEGNGNPTVFAGQDGTIGGSIYFVGGFGAFGSGGNAVIEGGQGSGGPGGDALIYSGTPVSGDAGNIRILAVDGYGAGAGNGGNVLIQSGAGVGAGTDGYTAINLVSGPGLNGNIRFLRDGVTQLKTILMPSSGFVSMVPNPELSVGYLLGYYLSPPPSTLNANGGAVALVAQQGNGTGTGGEIALAAGTGGTTGVGGDLTMAAGDGYTSGGTVEIFSGVASFGNGGDFIISAGNSIGGNGNGGSVIITPGNGNGSGTTGVVHVVGKLTVDGLIDPTGLVLTQQATVPYFGSGKGTLWVKNTSPTQLWYTDSGGTDRQVTPIAHGTANQVLVTDGTGTTTQWATLVDANVASSAAITVSKLAHGTANQVLVTDNGATTSQWAALTDANIATGAAIAVSKLANGAADQVLLTNHAGTGTAWGLITDNNVDPAAAIAGSKISADFTGQTVTSDALALEGANANIELEAVAAAPIAPAADEGLLWVKNTTPSQLWFTDGGGTDRQIAPLTGTTSDFTLYAINGVTTKTNGAGLKQEELGANLINVVSVQFLQGVKTFWEINYRMPTDWNGGTVTAKFCWFSQSAAAGNIVLGIQAKANSDATSIDQAYGTAQTVTDANDGNLILSITAATAALTIANAAGGGQDVQFQVYRDGTNGSDTLAATAELKWVLISYTRS